MKNFLLWCGVVLLLMAGQAQAQVGLNATPASPVAYQPFSLHAFGGACALFRSLDPSNRQISVQAGVLQVTVPYSRTFPCIVPVVPVAWDIPGIPAGNYRVELYGEFFDYPRTLIEQIDIVVQPGTVVAAPAPAVIPSTSWWSLSIIVFGVLGLMARRVRM